MPPRCEFRGVDRKLPLAHSRQSQCECGTLAESTFNRDVAAHEVAEPPTDCEPQPGTAVFACPRTVELREWGEQFFEILGQNADARVGDADAVPSVRCAPIGARLDGNTAVVSEFARVPYQVKQALPDADTIAVEGHRIAGDVTGARHRSG
jgi:hypothetical protein